MRKKQGQRLHLQLPEKYLGSQKERGPKVKGQGAGKTELPKAESFQDLDVFYTEPTLEIISINVIYTSMFHRQKNIQQCYINLCHLLLHN